VIHHIYIKIRPLLKNFRYLSMRCDLMNLLLLLQEPTSEDECIQQRESPPVFYVFGKAM